MAHNLLLFHFILKKIKFFFLHSNTKNILTFNIKSDENIILLHAKNIHQKKSGWCVTKVDVFTLLHAEMVQLFK